jgi:hypothetical protein
MVAHEMRANDPVEAHHEWWKKSGGHGTGRWSQQAFLAGTRWVVEQQTKWDSLTEREAIHELRKGQDSLFWPLFMNEARVWADCPSDGRVTVGVEGYCDRCGHDWMR